MVAHTAMLNLAAHVSYCKPCTGCSVLVLLESRVLDLAGSYTISLAGLKVVLKLLQQSSLLSPSGQSLFFVILGARFSTFASICVGVQAQNFKHSHL